MFLSFVHWKKYVIICFWTPKAYLFEDVIPIFQCKIGG